MTWTQSVRTQSRVTRRASETTVTALWRVGVLVLAFALWQAVSFSGVLPSGLVPSPVSVVVAWVESLFTLELWHALGLTLSSALIGLLLATLIGIPLGVVTGRFVAAELSTRFLLDFGRAFPAIALVAVLVLMLGRGAELKVALVFIAVVFPIAIQTQHGVRRIPASIVEATRAFRIPPMLFVRRVMLPSAAPSIMTGLRLAASVSVLVAVAAEVLTGALGLGRSIVDAQLGSNAPLAFAYILSVGLLGYGMNVGLERLQSRLIRWRPQGGGE